MELTDDMNPHDVACLLKEFFRSLPEPLMTVDLFVPFLATRSESALVITCLDCAESPGGRGSSLLE